MENNNIVRVAIYQNQGLNALLLVNVNSRARLQIATDIFNLINTSERFIVDNNCLHLSKNSSTYITIDGGHLFYFPTDCGTDELDVKIKNSSMEDDILNLLMKHIIYENTGFESSFINDYINKNKEFSFVKKFSRNDSIIEITIASDSTNIINISYAISLYIFLEPDERHKCEYKYEDSIQLDFNGDKFYVISILEEYISGCIDVKKNIKGDK